MGAQIAHSAGDGYADLSEVMRYYIGGLPPRAGAVRDLCAHRELVPAGRSACPQAPVNLGYSQRSLGRLPHPHVLGGS